MYKLSLFSLKKALKFLGIFAYFLFVESAFSSSVSDIESYVPPKVELKFQSNPYLERKRTKPIVWNEELGEYTQELEDWEKELFKDYFALPTYEITGPQKIEDNYQSENEILTAQDFEKY